MKVRFTATALIEIDDILAYLTAHNTKAAAKLIERIERTVAGHRISRDGAN
jgi:plasmid stabilization system protein ParE